MNKKLLAIFCALIILLIFSLVFLSNTTFESSELSLNHLVKPVSKNYVVISSNVDLANDFYYFQIPLAVLAWRRIGYEPVVIFVVTEKNLNPLLNKSIEYLNKLNTKYLFLKCSNEYDKLIGMVSRIFIGLIPSEIINDQDWVIVSDTDILPINRNYYQVENFDSIRILNAYCCGNFEYKNKKYLMFPMAHIGMKKKIWKKILGLDEEGLSFSSESMLKRLEEFYDSKEKVKKNNQFGKGDEFWYTDQKTISIAIQEYISKQSGQVLDKVSFKRMRLDRGYSDFRWNIYLNLFGGFLNDCHSFQTNVFQKLYLIRNLVKKIFSYDTFEFLDVYFDEYLKTKNSI